jgi:hypothetical protein
MKVDTPLLIERRDRIARYLLANGKTARGVALAAKLAIPESVVSGLLKHWSERGHFNEITADAGRSRAGACTA